MPDEYDNNRPTSYYLRPSYLNDYTQLLTWNDADESEVTFYEIGISLDTSELNVETIAKPTNPILIAFPKSYFTCTGHKSVVVRTNIHQPWAIQVRVRSLNGIKHQSDFAECHLGTHYEADYDGRFLNNAHIDKIPRFPHFSMSDVDKDDWSPNLFQYLHNWHWNNYFDSIEGMYDSFGRDHWQITRKQDGKTVKEYDRSKSTERHLPYSAKRIQNKVEGVSYTAQYDCCISNYELHGQEDIFVHFEFFGQRMSMQAKTLQQLRRVEMSTGEEHAPRFANGYWVL